MSLIIKEVSKEKLKDYAKIPIIVKVSSIYEIKDINNGIGGIILEEKKVLPYINDLGKYQNPLLWRKEFDIRNWGFFIAYENDIPIASCALVYKTKGINMLCNREDLTVLWDIRVNPQYKSKVIGTELFKNIEVWAKKRNCKQIKIETQNTNVNACKFYLKNGCVLGEINKYAYYKEEVNEVMLVWYKNL